MRYTVGSISKQFTATAILMLAEQGKLSLDDPVAKFLPSLTRAKEVTIRELLSHTSGYQDYWPQDYVPLFMTHATTAKEIIDRWASKPLDFDPGTKWQYSNTNYVIAGVIVEQVSGEPLMKFLQEHIFAPLDMHTIADVNMEGLGDTDATGYMRYALGPPRVAPKEAAGWLFAAGELAMTAGDLAKWDIGLMSERLLKPASYKVMETEVKLKDGKGTGYGLGIDVGDISGHRVLSHGGEVSGYVSSNYVFPDDQSAVAVLTNEDASGAAQAIARQISTFLLAPDKSGSAAKMQRDRKIFDDLQHGKIDRSLFTEDGNAYFTEQAIADFASSLGPLGPPQQASLTAEEERGGMTMRAYRITFATQSLVLTIYETPDGKIEQFLVAASG
jgi:CubicO group peptidase (beta-lactamase class C family)